MHFNLSIWEINLWKNEWESEVRRLERRPADRLTVRGGLMRAHHHANGTKADRLHRPLAAGIQQHPALAPPFLPPARPSCCRPEQPPVMKAPVAGEKSFRGEDGSCSPPVLEWGGCIWVLDVPVFAFSWSLGAMMRDEH